MISRSLVACLTLSATLISSAVYAGDPASCVKPRFSDVGWTDITATTQIASQILKSLGYKPDISVLSVAITFKSLENGDIDIFLGNWMPLQEPTQAPLVKSGKIEVAGTNLKDARIGFATSKAAYDAGLKTYADIARFKDQLGGKIYGIEPGSGANAHHLEDDLGTTHSTLAASSWSNPANRPCWRRWRIGSGKASPSSSSAGSRTR